MFKGSDYLTKAEDLHKFIKYLKTAMTRHDFYRYETATDTDQVKSLILCTTKMKENYLSFKDCLMICPCSKTHNVNRFGLLSLLLYGINSTGRNALFAFCLVSESDKESYEFVFRQFLTYMEQPPRHVLMKR